MTIREALAEGRLALVTAGKETVDLDSSLLLAKVLNTVRSRILAAGPETISEDDLASFRDLIKRRLTGECTACIIGRKEFRGLDFLVDHSVLVPRPDTETLVEAALETGAKANKFAADTNAIRILDLCTGSGAIAISLKSEMPELEVWATDISAEALEIAKINAKRLLPPESITFFQGNIFKALPCPPPIHFNLIISNPPYIPNDEIKNLSPEVQKEPRIAINGGADGLDIIRTIITEAPDYLTSGGKLMLEADPGQMEKITGLLEKRGFTDIKIYMDLSGSKRVISGIFLAVLL